MPRVLQICHDYQGPFRSVARQYAGSFIDCEVHTIFLRGLESAELASSIHGRVDFLTLGKGSLRGLKLEAIKKVRELIADDPPDIIIAHRYKPFFIAQMLAMQMEFGLIVGVMHEYGFLGRASRSFFSRFWKENVCLIGVSQPLCAEVRATHQHLSDRIHYVPHAIEAPTVWDAVSARHELGIPLGAFCFGTIGRLVSKKNHRLLIEAMARRDDNSVLAIVGDGYLIDELKKLARVKGVEDRVIFSGYKENARELITAFDVFVLSSTNEEAFGIVLLEAMAASIPIVSSDAPGPLGVVGSCALTFQADNVNELAAKMDQIASLSKPAAEALTKKGLSRLGEEFSISVMMRRIREIPGILQHAPISIE